MFDVAGIDQAYLAITSILPCPDRLVSMQFKMFSKIGDAIDDVV